MKKPKAKHLQLLEAMVKGKKFTRKEIAEKFSAGSPGELIRKLKVDLEVAIAIDECPKTGLNRYFIDLK